MFDDLPEEIIINILKQLEPGVSNTNHELIRFNKMNIIFILRLKEVNQLMKQIIESLRGLWTYVPYKKYNNPNNEITFTMNNHNDLFDDRVAWQFGQVNVLCQRNTNIKTFKWLMDNNIYFSLKNISQLIINNRKDVILLGFQYKDFLDIMFNRFYLFTEEIENLNPIVVAAVNNRIDIIKTLLEFNTVGNPFIKIIPKLLDISIKHNHRNLLNYLIVDHHDKITCLIQEKVRVIINRIDDCEDIMFYLLVNKKISVSSNLLLGCISKNYFDLFTHSYGSVVGIRNIELVKYCIEKNNYDIFNFLLSENRLSVSSSFLTENILKKKISSETFDNQGKFIVNIINNHLPLINKNTSFIERCIDLNINNEYVITLVDQGFKYTEKEIYSCLNNKNIDLLKILVLNLKEDMFIS